MEGKAVNELIEKIIEFSKKESYKLKQLSTVFYDVIHISSGMRACDEIAARLIDLIRKDTAAAAAATATTTTPS